MKIDIPKGLPVLKQARIENTNACGYKCVFCPREKMDRKQGVQSVEDFGLVMDRIEEYVGGKFSGSVHLHGYGEPLLDKNLIHKIKLCKIRWPYAKTKIISTLGYKFEPSYIESLVRSGLDAIIVSFYGSEKETYKKYTTVDRFDVALENLKLLNEYKSRHSSPMGIMVQAQMKGMELDKKSESDKQFLNELKKLNSITIHHMILHNYGNGRDYLQSKKLLCERGVKRDILKVTWDLHVLPCSMDYNAEEKWGNLRDMSIKDIFLSEKSTKFMKDHCEENADVYSICKNCTMRCLDKIS